MSSSPDSSLLRRTIELNYNNKKRSSSMKWIAVNGIFFLIFAYDLCGGCEGGLTVLQYVEAAGAGVALANLMQHGARLLPARCAALPLTPAQRRLLGLQNTSLDSSFREVSPETEKKPEPSTPINELDLSPLARSRSWVGVGAGTAQGSPPPSPPSPQVSPYPSPSRIDRDEFIADHQMLAEYLRRREDGFGVAGEDASWANTSASGAVTPPPPYQLAALDTEGAGEEGSGSGGGGGGGAAPLWRRLQLDPRRLTQFNLNLRLWLQVTILERVVREMDVLEAALAAHGLPPRALQQVGAERIRAAAAASGAASALAALQPFLGPFPDQRYVAARYRELAAGGCLSAYRWAGGGGPGGATATAAGGRPSDAELLLHAFAAYMDAQLPNEGSENGGFSSVHISRSSSPPRGRGVLAIHQVTSSPPHYVVACEDEVLEVGPGRNNLLHCLLVFVAACARRDPPALKRLHLGRNGLNMLWIIGR